MGSISVSDDTIEKLSALVDADRVTLDDEAERLLRGAIDQRLERLARVEAFRRTAAMTPSGVVQTDSVLLLREDRGR